MAVDKGGQSSATETVEKTEGAKTEAKEELDKTADKTGRVERAVSRPIRIETSYVLSIISSLRVVTIFPSLKVGDCVVSRMLCRERVCDIGCQVLKP